MNLSEDTQKILELTQKLMRFKSTATRPDEREACADFICKYLRNLGVSPERFAFGGIPSIVALPKHGYAPMLLMAHFDVVEADDDAQFTPVIKDGSLYGRGSVDDKYAVAMSLVFFEKHLTALRAEGRDIEDMPFGLLFTGDEENGGHDGAAKVLQRISTDFAIAIDGGTPTSIITKGKGILDLKLTAHGKAAHGARPWLGENAFDALIEDYAALKPIFPMEGEEHWHRTMNLGIVHVGGATANKVPGIAEATLDIRYTEHDDVDALLESIHGAVKGDVEILAREPMFYAGESRYIDLLRETNPDIESEFAHGASDARFLTDSGVPAVIWGAISEGSQHGPDEHITLDSLEDLTRRMDRFLTALREK